MASESAPAKRQRVSIDDDASLTGLTLEQLLGMTSHDFFSLHWEKAPLHRHRANTRLPCWNTLPSWSTLLRVIDHASQITESSVLTFKDREPSTEYASAPAAFVDGCSIIVNHVENADESVAVICKGLRESVPHAFCNMYVHLHRLRLSSLTPMIETSSSSSSLERSTGNFGHQLRFPFR